MLLTFACNVSNHVANKNSDFTLKSREGGMEGGRREGELCMCKYQAWSTILMCLRNKDRAKKEKRGAGGGSWWRSTSIKSPSENLLTFKRVTKL